MSPPLAESVVIPFDNKFVH